MWKIGNTRLNYEKLKFIAYKSIKIFQENHQHITYCQTLGQYFKTGNIYCLLISFKLFLSFFFLVPLHVQCFIAKWNGMEVFDCQSQPKFAVSNLSSPFPFSDSVTVSFMLYFFHAFIWLLSPIPDKV